MPMQWSQQALGDTGIETGPCAWSASLLEAHADEIHQQPSLVVFDERSGMTPGNGAALTDRLQSLPVLVILREPSFARYLRANLIKWLEALGRDRIDLVGLEVDEIRDLKAGGLVQPLVDARARGQIGQFGFVGETANDAEWLALNSSGRFIITAYSLKEQAAGYRAMAAAREYGMAVIAEPESETSQQDPRTSGFAIAQARHALSIRTRLLASSIEPMSEEDCELAWEAYSSEYPEPEKLPRGRPPAGAG